MLLNVLVLLSFVFMIFMNYFANTIPFGGNTTGDISRKYPTMFTPSGFTFSIWGVIYLLVTLFTIMIFINPDLVLAENNSLILYLFLSLNIVNSIWLLTWHNDYIFASFILMVAMLVILLVIMTSINQTQYITYLTFSVYAGWITIATVANISVLLYKLNWPIFMEYESIWFLATLIIVLMVSIYTFVVTRNIPYIVVHLWSYYGILRRYMK